MTKIFTLAPIVIQTRAEVIKQPPVPKPLASHQPPPPKARPQQPQLQIGNPETSPTHPNPIPTTRKIENPLPLSPVKPASQVQAPQVVNKGQMRSSMRSESEEDERDENFVIESENIDEKLYSSESSDSHGIHNNQVQAPPVSTRPNAQAKKLTLSSSSSASSPKKPVPEVKKAKPIQLKSESDASESVPHQPKKSAFDEEISGPEMEMEDDFWN